MAFIPRGRQSSLFIMHFPPTELAVSGTSRQLTTNTNATNKENEESDSET
jgi:hypothetical protein